jgi:hypothetical protein
VPQGPVEFIFAAWIVQQFALRDFTVNKGRQVTLPTTLINISTRDNSTAGVGQQAHPVGVDAVVDGALEVVKQLVSRRAQNHRGDRARARVLLQLYHTRAADLHHAQRLGKAQLVRRRRPQLYQRCRPRRPARGGHIRDWC